MQEKTCYLCGVWIREDQMSITRIPLWATSGESDLEQWKDTDAAMAFLNDRGEVVPFCVNCALTATKRCWDRIHSTSAQPDS